MNLHAVRTRKMILAIGMVLLTMVLCSCGSLVTVELPSVKRLHDDVEDYLNALAGNEVILYAVDIDQRVYDEKNGTMEFDCSLRFAWDEFGGENENTMAVHYSLGNDSWILASVTTDIPEESLSSRVVMHDLLSEMPAVPDVVRAAFAGDNIAMSDSLFDFTVELEGKVFRFPCSYASFALSGWEIAESSSVKALTTIQAQHYVLVDMVNGDAAITVYIANQTNSPAYVGQGDCVGVLVRPQDAPAVLAGGITGQSSAESVIMTYGIPDTDESVSGDRKMTYQASANSHASFLFQEDGMTIDLFALRAQAEQMQTAALFDTYNFSLTLDGMEYKLPVRLDTVMENGWEADETADLNDVLSWYETKTLTLYKGETSVNVTLRNPSMGDLRLYAASITGITLNQSTVGFSVAGPGGAWRVQPEAEQTEANVRAALGEPSRAETADGVQTLTYAAANGRYLRVTLSQTGAVLELQAYETDDAESQELQSFAFRISLSNNTYTLPAAATEFKAKMWVPDCGWLQAVKASSFVEAVMENRRTEEIVVYFVNPGEEITRIQDCLVGGLYAGPDAVNMIIGRSLEKGVEAAEVFDLFGIPAYDVEDGAQRYLVYGSSISRFLCVRCTDGLADALWIICLTD